MDAFTIAVVNQKGGVGKTATSYNLSYALAQRECKTLFVDMDPSANGTRGLISSYDEWPERTNVRDLLLNRKANISESVYESLINNCAHKYLHVIPSNIKLAKAQRDIINYPYKETLLHNHLKKVQYNYDFIMIDLPPTLTDLTINAIYSANFFIIPVKYEKDAFDGIADLFDIIAEIKQDQGFDYRILRNGLDGRKKMVLQAVNEKLKPFEEKGVLFKTIIRQDESIVKAKMNNEPVLTYSPNSHCVDDYKNLASEVIHVKRT